MAKAMLPIVQLGGTTFPVSRSKTQLSQLRYELISDTDGVDAADILTKKYGDEMLYIPNFVTAQRSVRNRAIHARFDERINPNSNPAYSSNEAVTLLAREYRLSDRRVWGILKVLPENNNGKMNIFG